MTVTGFGGSGEPKEPRVTVTGFGGSGEPKEPRVTVTGSGGSGEPKEPRVTVTGFRRQRGAEGAAGDRDRFGGSGEPKEPRVTVTGSAPAVMGGVPAVLLSFAITSFVLGAAWMSGQWLAPDRAALGSGIETGRASASLLAGGAAIAWFVSRSRNSGVHRDGAMNGAADTHSPGNLPITSGCR